MVSWSAQMGCRWDSVGQLASKPVGESTEAHGLWLLYCARNLSRCKRSDNVIKYIRGGVPSGSRLAASLAVWDALFRNLELLPFEP